MKRTLRSRRAVRAVGVVVAGAVAGAGLVATTAAAVAEDSPWSARPGFESKAAAPEVLAPLPGITYPGPWLDFSGSGEGGAAITISVNGAVVGEGVVEGGVGGGSGLWSVDVPSDTLPQQEPFSATVTQTMDGDVQEVAVDDLTVHYMPVFTDNPIPGQELSGDIVFEGRVVDGDIVALLLEGTLASGEEISKAAFSDASDPQVALKALAESLVPQEEDDGPDAWDGTFDFTARDAGSEWTFTPADALELGDYTISSAVVKADGEIELGNAVDFSVVSGGGGDETGGEDGTDEGAEDGTDEGAEDGTDEGAEDGTDEGAEDGTDEGAEDGTDEGAEDGTDEGAEDGTDEGAEDGTDEGAEDGTDEGAEDGTDEGAEDGTDEGAEDGTDEGAEEELPDTGSSGIVLTLAGLMLLAAGGVGVALRGRRATV